MALKPITTSYLNQVRSSLSRSWKGADSKWWCRCDGEAGSSNEQELWIGPQVEVTKTWGGGNSQAVLWSTNSSPSCYYGAYRASVARTDMENHCRGSQESCSQPTCTCRGTGDCTLPTGLYSCMVVMVNNSRLVSLVPSPFLCARTWQGKEGSGECLCLSTDPRLECVRIQLCMSLEYH